MCLTLRAHHPAVQQTGGKRKLDCFSQPLLGWVVSNISNLIGVIGLKTCWRLPGCSTYCLRGFACSNSDLTCPA